MRFAPQRRALFRHLNFQKCSEPFFFSFDFETCFAPQRRALFRHLIVVDVVVVAVAAAAVIGVVVSTSQLSKVVRAWCFLHLDFNMRFAPQWRAFFRHLPKAVRTCGACNILTLKCASRHDSMHFFNISPATGAPTDSRARYLDVIAFWHGLSQRGATVFSTVSLLFLLDGFVRKQICRKAECPTFSCFSKHHDTAYSAFQRLLNAYDISFFPKVPEHRRAFSTKMLARSCKILQASSL